MRYQESESDAGSHNSDLAEGTKQALTPRATGQMLINWPQFHPAAQFDATLNVGHPAKEGEDTCVASEKESILMHWPWTHSTSEREEAAKDSHPAKLVEQPLKSKVALPITPKPKSLRPQRTTHSNEINTVHPA